MILAEPTWSGPRLELDDLADHLRAQIKPELEPGERLVWASEPSRPPIAPGVSATKGMTYTALGFLTFGAALFGLRSVIGIQADGMGNLGATSIIMAFLTVLLMVVGAICRGIRFLFFLGYQRRPVYGLTDRRAIFLTPVAGTKAVQAQSIPLESIRPELIRRIQLPDGSGDLLFLPEIASPGGISSFVKPNSFHGLANVREVDLLLRRLLVQSDPTEID